MLQISHCLILRCSRQILPSTIILHPLENFIRALAGRKDGVEDFQNLSVFNDHRQPLDQLLALPFESRQGQRFLQRQTLVAEELIGQAHSLLDFLLVWRVLCASAEDVADSELEEFF